MCSGPNENQPFINHSQTYQEVEKSNKNYTTCNGQKELLIDKVKKLLGTFFLESSSTYQLPLMYIFSHFSLFSVT